MEHAIVIDDEDEGIMMVTDDDNNERKFFEGKWYLLWWQGSATHRTPSPRCLLLTPRRTTPTLPRIFFVIIFI